MALLYIARSANLSKWAADVGLGKHVFKVGIADDKAALKQVVDDGWAGESDWRVVSSEETDILEENAVFDAVARKEKLVDPSYYPRIKGAAGIFRVNIAHVQNAMLIAQAMSSADDTLTAPAPKAKDIATYLLRAARTPSPAA